MEPQVPEGFYDEGHTHLVDTGPQGQQAQGQVSPEGFISETATPSSPGVNPAMPALGGAALGVAAPVPRHIIEKLASGPSVTVTGAPAEFNNMVVPPSPGAKYAAKTGYGAGEGYTVEDVVNQYKNQSKPIGSGKVSSNIARNSPMNIDAMQQLQEAKAAEEARRAETLRQEARAAMSPLERTASDAAAKLPEPVRNVAQAIDEAVVPASKQWWARGVRGAGRALQGGAAVGQGVDAYNRFNSNDPLGGVISGIGALGSAATFIPHPVARIGGTAISLGAEGLNALRDNPEALRKYMEIMNRPENMPMMAQGGLVYLR